MKEYNVKLNEEMTLTASDGEKTHEIGMCLQIWQDLNKLDSTNEEDILIKNILEQILEKEFNGVGNIPVPNYYNEQQD
jgi:hypothetical protein